jgi:N-acetylmuramoyl-L-alanine amidase
MKPTAALAISVTVIAVTTLLAQTERTAIRSVSAIRNWSLTDVSRVAIEVSGDFQFRSDRLHNPERIYFDILNARPRLVSVAGESRRFYSKELDDKLVKRIRVAETNPGITRVVLELAASAEVSTSQLSNPNRLMIEVRIAPGASPETVPPAPPVRLAAVPTLPSVAAAAAAKLPAVLKAEPPKSTPPDVEDAHDLRRGRGPVSAVDFGTEPRPSASVPVTAAKLDSPAVAAPPAPPMPGEFGRAARRTSSGQSSLTRALGLKLARVVIDPGHGGHDQGTQGPKGLVEKELVLDVALRVGKLIEEQMGAEVIYTRSDDTFVPLEGRTALANEKKADLFLSIHANSSPFPRIAGVETFYLNFTDSKEALDVAARENASSQKSIFELQDIIQKITLHEKLDESKEFASRLQASLFSLSSRNVPGQRNRGVKKAPFVVLIAANMPSVLAEIGFVSNPREEALLKKPDYRQKVADALYRGLSRYADSLSHFQMAQGGATPPTPRPASKER